MKEFLKGLLNKKIEQKNSDNSPEVSSQVKAPKKETTSLFSKTLFPSGN